MQKKVMIYAYTNFNLGDDLFIKILCERYPKINFVLFAPKEYKYTFENFDNISIYPSNNYFLKLLRYGLKKIKYDFSPQAKIAKKCDAIVQIGGSIFIQRNDWNGMPKHKTLTENPYFVLGANFGPFQDQQFYYEHYKLFKQYKDVCLRDNYSYELFKDLKNVRKADDIVFQLNKNNTIALSNSLVISVIKPSYRECLNGYDESYYKKIKDITIYYINKGYTVTLMAFCVKEGDKEAIDEILKLIHNNLLKHANRFLYQYNITEALNIIASSTLIVATRFHAMILGWVYNKPVFPIAYSKKMNNVMNDVSYSGSYTNLKEIDILQLEYVYKSIQTNLVDVSVQAKNATNHFKKLDEYLLND